MKWAVFLDRDGVINVDIHHLHAPDQLQLIPGSAQAIRSLNERSIPVIVITNQSVVARHIITETQLHEIHQSLSSLLDQFGAHIDRFYYCPHHPTEGLPPYQIDCECRKPKPGMLLQAARDFEIDLSRSYFIGDTLGDMQAGYNAGCHTVLVQTGYGEKVKREWQESFQYEHYALDLERAVKWVLTQLPLA